MRRIFLFLMLLAGVSFGGDFSIDKFSDSETGEVTDYIKGLATVQATEVTEGGFYLRQKFEDPFEEDATHYQIFKGTRTDLVGKLQKFTIEGAPLGILLRAKIYINKGAEADEDLEVVYFDGKNIYVEDEAKVFAQYNGKMIELAPSQDRPSTISLSSEPGGAAILVDGQRRGTTPAKFEVLGVKPMLVTLQKEGYYNAYKVITPTPGQTVSEGLLLTESKKLDDPSLSFSNRLLQASRAKDVAAMTALNAELTAAIGTWPSQVQAVRKQVESYYPKLAAKAGNEPADMFTIRQNAYKQDLAATLLSVEQAGNAFKQKLVDVQAKIAPAIAEAQAAPVVAEAEPEPENTEEVTPVEETSEEVAEEQAEETQATDEAEDDITERFGYGDDIKKYTGYGLLALSAVSLGMTAMEIYYTGQAQDAVDQTQALYTAEDAVVRNCRGSAPGSDDAANFCLAGEPADTDGNGLLNEYNGTLLLQLLQEKLPVNKSNLADHQSRRLLWGVITGVTLTGGVVLLTVPF